MKILLINANRVRQPWPVIPFGLCCIAAAIENVGHDVQVLDLCFSNNCEKDIKESVSFFKPELIGISIRNIDNCGYKNAFFLDTTRDEVVNPLKKIFNGTIIIGGPAVGISPIEILSFLDLEYAVRGDAEVTIVDIIDKIVKGESLNEVDGLIIRRGNKIIVNNPSIRNCNLNQIPFPEPHYYVDILMYQRYGPPLQIQTKRGCAQKCSYCSYNTIEGTKYRYRDPRRIADEIEYLVRKTNIRFIEFTDSTFNIPLNHAKEVLREIGKKKMKVHFRTMGLNPGAVDEELVALMKEVGFCDVDLGVESFSDTTLRGLGKNFSKKDIIKAVKLLHGKNIAIAWYLMLGAPGETKDTLKETFEAVNKVASKWDLINIGCAIRVYNGSPLAEKMLKQDSSCTDDNFLHPIFYIPESIDLDTVKLMTQREALKNANYFLFDEEETTPPFVLRFSTLILKLFAPRQPIWRCIILLNLMKKYTGVIFLKSVLFRFRIKNLRNKKDLY